MNNQMLSFPKLSVLNDNSTHYSGNVEPKSIKISKKVLLKSIFYLCRC